MRTTDILGVMVAVLVLAGISVAIINGKNTAAVIGQAGSSFADIIKAATLQPGSQKGK